MTQHKPHILYLIIVMTLLSVIYGQCHKINNQHARIEYLNGQVAMYDEFIREFSISRSMLTRDFHDDGWVWTAIASDTLRPCGNYDAYYYIAHDSKWTARSDTVYTGE